MNKSKNLVGALCSIEKHHSTGRPAISEENVDRIRQAFVSSSKTSTTPKKLKFAIL